jgi:uncharacterized protein (TIRG00374 family)
MKRVSKAFGVILRLGIAFGIIAYLLSSKKMDLQHLLEVLSGTLRYWPWVAAAMFLFFLCMWAGILRWRLILDAQGIHLPLRRVFSIFFIGHFFNAFMMGSTGGDLIKAVYTAKETHHKKTEAIATVFADRAIGVVALFSLAAVLMIARPNFFLSHKETWHVCSFMLILIAATALGLYLMFSRHIFERVAWLRRLEEKFSFGPVVRRSYDCFYLCRTRPALLSTTLLFSVANHLLTVVGCYCLGRSLQIPNLPLDYLTLFPLIMSIASLPITPGGLGVREGTAVVLLSAAGVPSAQALPLSLFSYFAMVGWSLFGGAIFLFYSGGGTIRGKIEEIRHEIDEEGAEETAVPEPAPPA